MVFDPLNALDGLLYCKYTGLDRLSGLRGLAGALLREVFQSANTLLQLQTEFPKILVILYNQH
jgi:hypothetical protein